MDFFRKFSEFLNFQTKFPHKRVLLTGLHDTRTRESGAHANFAHFRLSKKTKILNRGFIGPTKLPYFE
uniref:Uncharacterized protein n=1 Tax=Pararge aegeria TaxID=116150 RepID=S4NFJ7_9NEOP